MAKWLIIFLIVCQLSACKGNANEKNGEGPLEARYQKFETENQRKVFFNNNEPLSHTDAENLIRMHLGLINDPNTVIAYDHEENGNYVIQVYKIDNTVEKFIGFYTVNPKTGEIIKQLK
jgi:hypothetical protein